MEICIFEKTTKINSYKTASPFIHQPWENLQKLIDT